MSALGHFRRAAIVAGCTLLVLAPAARAADAPLDPLSGAEIRTAIKAIENHASFPDGAFFPLVQLKEPSKAALLAWSPGRPFTREAFANVYEPSSNRLWEAVVDLKANPARVAPFVRRSGFQPAVYLTEYTDADTAVRESRGWQDAMRARGITGRQLENVYLDVWAPGDVELPAGSGTTRLLRALSFWQGPGQANPYDRPIEGVSVTVAMSGPGGPHVIDVVDTGVRPINKTVTGNADRPRTGLKPLKVVQPNGPSFTRNGNLVSWQGWRFRVGFNPREGMVLHDIGYDDGHGVRSIIRRIALDEIYVPYGLPDRTWVWRAALDVGEYNLGQFTEPLEQNVDVPDNAVFYDEATFNDVGSTGEDPAFFDLPNAVAIYERTNGSLWDRTDPTTFERDARFARELVVTAAVVNGNYTYNVEYVFRLDGGIDVVAGATGTTLNRGVPDPFTGDVFSTLVARNIAAPTHQHFFNFRIDFDVDGTSNRVIEENTDGEPSDLDNEFVTDETPLTTEGFRDHNPATTRRWVVESSTKTNGLGTPTGYEIEPDETSQPYSEPNYEPLIHAPFAQHGFWVTQYKDGELHSVGDYPNQGPAGEGLVRYANGQSIADKDVVVWYTAAFTHDPAVEEFPVMTRETLGFKLRPDGFFDENPALDVPPAG